uniref:Glycine zipper 2TM domain-containing protein n=1 Tax=Craspedostauros australis TaxID=1486917 RepID=A0A7R9WWT1_9STRA
MKFVPTVVLALWLTTAFPSCVFATASPTKKPWSIMGGHANKAGSKNNGGIPGCAFAPHNLHGTTGVTTAGAVAGAAGGISPTPSAGMRLPSVRGLWKALCTAILPQDFEFVKKVLFVAIVGAVVGAVVGVVVGGNLIEKGVKQADKVAKQRVDHAAEKLQDIVDSTWLNFRKSRKKASSNSTTTVNEPAI